ncbi:MAG: DoxX family protein [Pseudomonadales bacterium]
MGRLVEVYWIFTNSINRYLADVTLLLLRLVGAKVFLESGLTKWNGWFDFNELKYDLFLYEFFCPDPVRPGALLLCNPETLDYESGSFVVTFVESLALTAGILEILLPTLLILGIFTRLGALGLLGMTLFIQLAVYPTWDHWWNPAVWWALVMLTILAKGPGLFSADRFFGLEGRGQR